MTTPQAGRRYRRAAAFLIHWRDGDKDLAIEGALEVLHEVEREEDPDGTAMTGFVCALAELTWKVAEQGDPEAAMEYLRRVAAQAAVDEVSAGAGGEQG